MNKKANLGILVLHGIGVQYKHFADDFIVEMNNRLKNDFQIASGEIAWEVGFWADLLNDRETKLFNGMKDTGTHWNLLRWVMINFFADAIAYQTKPGRDSSGYHSTYKKIHQRIGQHLKTLHEKLKHDDIPVIVLAHSLGSVIISNYIWDQQQKKVMDTNKAIRLTNLAGLVTFGSPIPMFTLGLDTIKSIQLNETARWLNFYDPDDVIGCPLNPLKNGYEKVEDISVNVGNILTSWNPLSHNEYWHDDHFQGPVLEMIVQAIKMEKIKKSIMSKIA